MSFDHIVNNPEDNFLIPVLEDTNINPDLVGLTQEQVATINLEQPSTIEAAPTPCLPCQQKALEGMVFPPEIPGAPVTPEETQVVDLALIIDNRVVEFVRTHARTAAALLSNPVVIDVTGKVAEWGGFLTEGMFYDETTRTFYAPVHTLEY